MTLTLKQQPKIVKKKCIYCDKIIFGKASKKYCRSCYINYLSAVGQQCYSISDDDGIPNL